MRFIPSATRSRCTDAKVACGFEGIGKVKRRCRFGQNLPQTSLSVLLPENLATACHALLGHPATETSDWQEIRKYRGTAYRRSRILTLHL
ncbi:hypothetical protein GKD58_06215 [Parabacteroides distasonis]|uniref:Uncharacterized protein n=1 Tax=Parabacteroides distasonis TaxID=823 RepID=A0A6I2N8V9_PARDI|nr:hypothetical protein [Parabacteroides distasonis]MRZ07141.1 hypothetical protein [Parabacteroides distasonis]RLT68868.1 hypothetical protein D7V92_14525 [Parabacteroides sp. CH2-D42-20]